MTSKNKSRKTLCDIVMESKMSSAIPESTVIFNAQSVYEAFLSGEIYTLPVFVENGGSKYIGDYRTRPPFDNIFVEYIRDIDFESSCLDYEMDEWEKQTTDELHQIGLTWLMSGVLCEKLDRGEIISGAAIADVFKDEIYDSLIPYRISFFSKVPLAHEPEVCDTAYLIWYDREGYLQGELSHVLDVSDGHDFIDHDSLKDTAMLTMALIHHKDHDIEYVDYPERYIKRERRMGKKPPSGSFHINIDVPAVRKQQRKHGMVSKRMGVRPHIRRGYFRDFTDHPLPQFAKLGVHYVESHDVGKDAKNKIASNYSVRIIKKGENDE